MKISEEPKVICNSIFGGGTSVGEYLTKFLILFAFYFLYDGFNVNVNTRFCNLTKLSLSCSFFNIARHSNYKFHYEVMRAAFLKSLRRSIHIVMRGAYKFVY